VAAVALSASTVVPLPVLGGVAGSLLGALALLLIARGRRRWGGERLAGIAVGLGLLLGGLPLVLITLLRADDWGGGPFAAAVTHVVAVGALAGASRTGGRIGPRAAAGAAGATATVAAIGVLALAGVLFVVYLLVLLFESVTGVDLW
jgi:hypothetical protein